MRISTEIKSIAEIVGGEKAVEYCAKAGFDAWDFSLNDMVNYDRSAGRVMDNPHPLGGNYLAYARKLRQVGLDNGIVCNQSHAPFPVKVPEIRDALRRAIECTAEAGGEICVIHPDNDKSPEENAEMYFDLLPFAKSHCVKIATENMWNWDLKANHSCFAACATPASFNAHLDAVNDDYFVACLDIGHAEMLGSDTSAVEMIKALGNRLAALHIHDNNKLDDSHQIPGSMDIDFDAMVKALHEIGYNGYFTLEANCYLRKFNADNAFEGIKNLAASARALADKFDAM